VIYHYNADRYLIPASNMKIITTAAALQRLDPEAPIRSTSVRNWVTITNQRSNNAYADTLLRYIGGPGAAKTALAQMGVNPGWIRQADGSGVSRHNIATPRAFVEILRAMYYSPKREVFHASLPIAGMSGTLRHRMRATPAQGTVYAKTGTLQGVRALSGYIHHPHYGILVFSIITNNPRQSGKALVKAIDQIVLQLSLVTPCEQ
jgi:D-alanyl-D-alanine carboxypeptidase/D-alanyl-D-alanine-endopeptidase (penicillin-binding protein 4)